MSAMALPAVSVPVEKLATVLSARTPSGTHPKHAKPHSFLRSTGASVTRDLKSQHSTMTNHFGVDKLFDQPTEDWTSKQWIALAVIMVLAIIVLSCVCNIIRCVVGCLCSCLLCSGGTPRQRYYHGGYYNASIPADDFRPPPFNPSYTHHARSMRWNVDETIMRPSNECSILDCLTLLCCLQCYRHGRCSLRNLICGICCFEFCCRGGHDILGNGRDTNGYGTFA